MSNVLNVALIQPQLAWQNPDKNLKNFSKKIEGISESINLIVLPEMFTSGFTMNPKGVSETMEGETIMLLKALAKQKNTAIVGSLVIEENAKYYNRCVFIHPTGKVETYDKRHTFTLAGEHKVYTAGTETLFTAIGLFAAVVLCPVFSCTSIGGLYKVAGFMGFIAGLLLFVPIFSWQARIG